MDKLNKKRYQSLIKLLVFTLILFNKISYANDLKVRNPYQAKANIQSKHFTYWFNDSDTEIDIQKLQRHLDIIEEVKKNLIDIQGYKSPISEYKMNIYMEDAGGNVPSGEIASVFVDYDSENFMFIHMSKKKLKDSDQLIRALLAHEFFHTIQFSYYDVAKMYQASFDYYWFQEGAASWASYVAWDDVELLKYWGLWALVLRPELYLTYSNFDNYNGSSAQRMYSTSFFLWWISEYYADDELIKHVLQEYETKEQNNENYPSPMTALTNVVSEIYGYDLEKIFVDFAAHNVLLDYPKRNAFLQRLTDDNTNIDDSISMAHQQAMGAWQNINHHNWHGEQGPAQSWASSYIKLDSSEINEVEINFKGLLKGSSASNVRWHLTLVKSISNSIQYHPISLNDNFEVTAELIDTSDVDTLYLSITAFSDTNLAGEKFDYAYQLASKGNSLSYEPVDWSPVIPRPDKSSGGSVFWLLSILIFALLSHKYSQLMEQINKTL